MATARDTIETMLEDMNPDALFIDNLDDAIIGIGSQFTGETLVVYSATKIINHLTRGGMDYEEAEEWFGFNIASAYMGEGTPIIVDDWFIEEDNHGE